MSQHERIKACILLAERIGFIEANESPYENKQLEIDF